MDKPSTLFLLQYILINLSENGVNTKPTGAVKLTALSTSTQI